MPASSSFRFGLTGFAALAFTFVTLLTSDFICAQSAEVLDVFSPSSVDPFGQFSFSSTTATDLSGSTWGFGVDESTVYHAALKHQQTDGTANRDWEIRIGNGGQIYSIKNELGELVPPQSLERHFVDEVFQAVSVDTSPRDSGGEAAFYHQAGYYTDGNNITRPTYAPMLNSGAVEANSFSTLSLAVQADSNSDPQVQSGILNFQRTRDLGDGVIEVTHAIYNFGTNTVDFHNLPWGGVRKTKLDHMLVSNPGGGFTDRAIESFGLPENQVENVEDTGGWAAFAEGSDGSSQGIGYVFGDSDTHLDEDWQTSRSSWRWGDGGGDILGIPVRDFNVGTFRRSIDVNPGDLFESRHFLVLGDVDHIESTVADRGLVDAAIYDKIDISEQDSSTIGYRIESDDNGITVLETGVPQQASFRTWAKPVRGSKPLFLLEDADGKQYLSVDPYALSPFPYSGITNYEGFLGFVLPEDITEGDGPYIDMTSLFPESFYLNTSPGTSIVALRGLASVPEPNSTVFMLIVFNCFMVFKRADRSRSKWQN